MIVYIPVCLPCPLFTAKDNDHAFSLWKESRFALRSVRKQIENHSFPWIIVELLKNK